jgi:hypothetical protein
MVKEIGNWGKQQARGRRADDSRTIIEPLLETGETLVWTARSRGQDTSSHAIYALAFSPVFVSIVALVIFVNGDPLDWTWNAKLIGVEPVYGLGLLVIVIGLLFTVALRSFLAPSYDRYGLTDRRLIIAERIWFSHNRSFMPDQIHILEVRGSDESGSVRFAPQKFGRANRQYALIGIERPAAVAELIRSTLKSDLTVKRLPGEHHIPLLEPRQP